MSWLAPLDIGVTMGLILASVVVAFAIAFELFHFPDLTVEGSLPLGAAAYALSLRNDWSIATSVGFAAASGAAMGIATAVLFSRFRLDKFLAGILVVAISYSLSLRLMGASNIGLLQEPSIFTFAQSWDVAIGGPFRSATLLLLVVVTAIFAGLFLIGLSSRPGLRIRSAGCNEALARSLGVNVTLALTIGLALTNALAAVGGAVLASYQGFADVSMGIGTLVIAIVAMTIGKSLFPSGRLRYPVFVVTSAITGSVVYQVIVAYALRLGLAATDLKLATALLVILVIAPRASKDTELSRASPS